MQTSSPVLAVHGLSAFYGRAQALWDVSFELSEGMGLGVIGLNGAGKSTLLRSVTRVHRAVAGEIAFRGKDIMPTSPYALSRLGVSFVREAAPVFTDLTVEDHLELGAELARRRGKSMPMKDLMEIFPRLEHLLKRRAGLLSGGQRQMVALAAAVVSRPSFIVLDEPSAGLSPEAAATITQAIRDLRSTTGLAVLIAEQNEDWLEGVASHVLVLERGHVVCDDGANSPVRELSSTSPSK
jgi:branched-chain amino acid transport system ATP-binding protein